MRNLKSLIYVIVIVTIASGCKKENSSKAPAKIVTNATIRNSGEVAADGCGWVVDIDSTNEEYSPVNLSSNYQKDGLKVNVTYHVLTSKLSCGGFAGGGMTQIQLDVIKAP